MTHDTSPHTNHLIHETSPYLRQHAHNPVDWYPWGPEAFARARREGKLVLLSVAAQAAAKEGHEDDDHGHGGAAVLDDKVLDDAEAEADGRHARDLAGQGVEARLRGAVKTQQLADDAAGAGLGLDQELRLAIDYLGEGADFDLTGMAHRAPADVISQGFTGLEQGDRFLCAHCIEQEQS
jgi:hypothetical protein